MVKIIHPFHPLSGRSFVFVTYRHNWGEDRVHYQDEQGQVRSVPTHWTDLLPSDPFRVLAAGRAYFRPSELQQLATLLARLKSAPPLPPAEPTGPAVCLGNQAAFDK